MDVHDLSELTRMLLGQFPADTDRLLGGPLSQVFYAMPQ